MQLTGTKRRTWCRQILINPGEGVPPGGLRAPFLIYVIAADVFTHHGKAAVKPELNRVSHGTRTNSASQGLAMCGLRSVGLEVISRGKCTLPTYRRRPRKIVAAPTGCAKNREPSAAKRTPPLAGFIGADQGCMRPARGCRTWGLP
jgi:hypothetical protein